MSGTCLNASEVFFASNSHVEMGKTIVQSVKLKKLRFFTTLGISFAAPYRDNTLSKNAPKTKF